MVARWLGTVVLGVLLMGCMTVQADELAAPTAAPEDAVFAWMGEQPSAVANTVAIHQVLPVDAQRASVLASFRPPGWDFALPALAHFEVGAERGQWVVRAHEVSSDPYLADETLTFHTHATGDARTLAATYGLVVEPRARRVQVRWSDGVTESAPVVNGTYFSLRPDQPARGIRVTALNAAGATLADFKP